MLKLHLILPNAEKKNPSSREVTTNNYQECFSLMKESALFEFKELNLGRGHVVADEESIQQDLGIIIISLLSLAIFLAFLMLVITLQILTTLESYCVI